MGCEKGKIEFELLLLFCHAIYFIIIDFYLVDSKIFHFVDSMIAHFVDSKMFHYVDSTSTTVNDPYENATACTHGNATGSHYVPKLQLVNS